MKNTEENPGAGSATRPRGRSRSTAVNLALFSTGAAVALLATTLSPLASPDSYSYLEAARNLSAGNGYVSDLIFTSSPLGDPPPLTIWPPGYPIAVATLMSLGVADATAARLVSIVCFALLVVTVRYVGRCSIDDRTGVLAALFVAAWPVLVQHSGDIESESLFLAATAGALLCLIHALDIQSAPSYRLLSSGAILLGLAVVTRYLGIVFVPATSLAIVVVLQRTGGIKAWIRPLVVWAGIATLPAALWMTRNLAIGGSLAGPRTLDGSPDPLPHLWTAIKTVGRDLGELTARVLVLPELLGLPVVVSLAALLLFLLLLISFGAARRQRPHRYSEDGTLPTGLKILVTTVAGYGIGMVALRGVVQTADPLDSRMMMAIYPFVAVLLATTVTAARSASGRLVRRLPIVVGALAVVAVAATLLSLSGGKNGIVTGLAEPPDYVATLEDIVGEDALLVGNRLFEANHFLDTTVITFSAYPYSSWHYDCDWIRQHLERLAARKAYFVVKAERNGVINDDLLAEYPSEFRRLAAGDVPAHFDLQYSSETLIVYAFDKDKWSCPLQ